MNSQTSPSPDNSVDFHIAPGAAVDAPPVITWTPDLGLFTFETAAKFLADRGYVGDRWLEVKDEEFQMLLNMENDRVRASSYVLAILGAAKVIDVDGRRPNKVRLAG